MKVKDVMTRSPRVCRMDTDLAEAAMEMWDGDCGSLPVLGEEDRVVGMITDRDICMAAATQHRPAFQITVGEVVQLQVHACSPDDSVEDAAAIMETYQVRRLPVVDKKGRVTGVLSLNDLILGARRPGTRSAGIAPDKVLRCVRSISQHRTARAMEASE